MRQAEACLTYKASVVSGMPNHFQHSFNLFPQCYWQLCRIVFQRIAQDSLQLLEKLRTRGPSDFVHTVMKDICQAYCTGRS